MTQENIIIMVVIAIIAFIIGFFIGKTTAGNSSDSPAAKKASEELENYKKEVSQHFGKTADLVDNLTASYKDVFEHLGSSAKKLMTSEEVDKHITSRAAKAVTLTYITESNATKSEAIDPMQAAQDEINTEEIIVEAEQEAKKMAETIVKDNKPTKTEVKTESQQKESKDSKSPEAQQQMSEGEALLKEIAEKTKAATDKK